MRPRILTLAAVIVLAVAGLAHAQDGPFVEAMAELSPVQIGSYQSTWRVGRMGGGVQRDGRFGWNVGVERHQRGGLIDWAGQFRALKQDGYRFAVSLETHWNGGGSPEESSRKSWAGMKRLLEETGAL